MKKGILIFTLLILTVSNCIAQKHELGKVTLAELEEKQHPLDTSAVAAILFKTGEVTFEYSADDGFFMKTVVKTKIKIYKKEGYEWANQAVMYNISSEPKDQVYFVNEATYNLVGGKIEKTKLKSDGKFDEVVNKYWGRKKIAMPNVKAGSIIEYEYEIKTRRIGELREWYFQSSIPVNYSEFKTNILEYFVYNLNMKGYYTPKKTERIGKETLVFFDRDRNQEMETRTVLNTSQTVEVEKKATSYVLENLPAMKGEAYVNNINNYRSSLSHELVMTKYPNAIPKSYGTDWATVTKTIYDYDSFGGELNKTGYFENDINTLITGLNSREEKIAAIFNFVKNKVKWNNFDGYSCDLGVKRAYKDMTGNAAEINLMLTSMLRYAGIQANPVVLSTRSNGIALFPTTNAYNYVITGVELDNQVILLDATNKYSLPNILPIQDLNWYGRMIRKDGSSANVDLMPKSSSKDVVNLIVTINNEGEIQGKVKEQYFDYNAFVYRDFYGALNKESRIEKIEKSHPGTDIEELDVINKNELDKPVIENYTFKNNNSVEIIGDKMYFSPLLFFASTENPFKEEKREYPIDFSYPYQDKYAVNITIPDGYIVESLPKSVSIPMSENKASFKYLISNTDKQIQLSVTSDINAAIIPSDYYEELKAFYNEIIKKETEKIVLKKI